VAAESQKLMQVLRTSWAKTAGPTFSDARDEYLKKTHNRRSLNEITLAFNFAVAIIGNRPLKALKRSDGKAVLAAMLSQDWKTATVRRRLAVLSAMVATGLLEFEIDARNPFASLSIPNMGKDAKDVRPFSEPELQTIAAECLLDGEAGLIAGILLETGLRVSEAAFIRIEDLNLDASVPHLHVRENATRRIKNTPSARKIPLLQTSLAAARMALSKAVGSPWLFPEIASPKSNVASKRINSWLRKILGGLPHSHEFRHSVETRLRNAGVHQGVVNAIMGHAGKEKVADMYFGGYKPEVLAEALGKIALKL